MCPDSGICPGVAASPRGGHCPWSPPGCRSQAQRGAAPTCSCKRRTGLGPPGACSSCCRTRAPSARKPERGRPYPGCHRTGSRRRHSQAPGCSGPRSAEGPQYWTPAREAETSTRGPWTRRSRAPGHVLLASLPSARWRGSGMLQGPVPACRPPISGSWGISQGTAVGGQEAQTRILHLKEPDVCP